MGWVEMYWTLIAFLIGLYILAWAILGFWRKPRGPSPIPCSTLIVLGSGGHTTEMLTIAARLDRRLYSPRIYVMAKSDLLSRRKVENMEWGRSDFGIETVHRVREVRQSWLTVFLYSFPLALMNSADAIKFNRPSLILCNGPGICVPICLVARLYQIMFGLQCVVVYVESICRVKRLSLTGKILRNIVDRFVVQWPDVQNGKIACFGRIS